MKLERSLPTYEALWRDTSCWSTWAGAEGRRRRGKVKTCLSDEASCSCLSA